MVKIRRRRLLLHIARDRVRVQNIYKHIFFLPFFYHNHRQFASIIICRCAAQLNKKEKKSVAREIIQAPSRCNQII